VGNKESGTLPISVRSVPTVLSQIRVDEGGGLPSGQFVIGLATWRNLVQTIPQSQLRGEGGRGTRGRERMQIAALRQ
jgi:hypothetical protein